ncbi:hypothetical protein WICMUC_002490 [Wickerhamomyces mucosus]|uniref:Uncharacterized protein n=1 Tax=Wickerhamomyces mucosus TaxID=1378264 RepID=A0A9P8TEH5_9ASCO|nr:hypothetical protein WICMUC_002490 [Wickerhamomyces mucosus]
MIFSQPEGVLLNHQAPVYRLLSNSLPIDHTINSRFNFNDGKDITDKDRFVIDGLSKKLISLPNDSFWKVINSLYFKYLLKKCNNKFQLSKIITIYENSNKNFIQKKQQHESSLLLNPFNEFNTEYYKTNHNSNLCLNLNTQFKIIIVKSILDKSIKLKSSKFINWSCLNLLELGFNSKEIKLDLYKKLDSRLINYGLKLDEDFKEFDKIWGKKTKGKFLEKRDFL